MSAAGLPDGALSRRPHANKAGFEPMNVSARVRLTDDFNSAERRDVARRGRLADRNALGRDPCTPALLSMARCRSCLSDTPTEGGCAQDAAETARSGNRIPHGRVGYMPCSVACDDGTSTGERRTLGKEAENV